MSTANPPINFSRLVQPPDIASIIHCIALHGDDIVGLELGVFQAISFCAVLQCCPNVKRLHGVDSWQPYSDCLKDPYDGTPAYSIDKRQIQKVRRWAFDNIARSRQQHRAEIHEKDSAAALSDFDDESLDFIFIDTYMTYEQAKSDLESWYPKVKRGGIFAGHDWNSEQIQRAVKELRVARRVSKPLSSFDNTWIWYK